MKYLLALLFCWSYTVAFTQKSNNVGIVTGNIIEAESRKAISQATIVLVSLTDSSVKFMQISGKNGSFEIDKLPMGYFRLLVTHIGFSSLIIDSIHLRSERFDFNLGDLNVKPAFTPLTEVTVYVEKPLIESREGKIIYNVGESALANGSSAADILKTIPLVSSHPTGNILLKSKEPVILIDDKPTELNSQQLTNLLESLSGSIIEKVELISHPSAQFASSPGGVINIITKKSSMGLTGKVTMAVGSRREADISSTLSYRNRKLTLNADVTMPASRFTGSSYSRRTNIYTDSVNFFHTEASFENYNFRPNLRFLANYELTRQHTLNAVLQGNYNDLDNNTLTAYKNMNRNYEIYKLSTRSNAIVGNGFTSSLTLSYSYKGVNPLERLQVIATGNLGNNDNLRQYFQQFLNPDYTFTGIDSTQHQEYNYLNNLFSLRLNYDKPFRWKKLLVASGISYSRNNNHNALQTRYFRKADQQFVQNELLSNDFKFYQEIFIARSALNILLLKALTVTAGTQAEQTNNVFFFIKGNAPNANNTYWNVLPFLALRKDFNKKFNTSFNYRAIIRRPGINELNPTIDYTDPYNIRFGNPYLNPSVADNFDLSANIIKSKYYVNLAIGYNRVKNVYNTIRTLTENRITQTTYKNISSRNEYESSVLGSFTFGKKLKLTASAGYSYNEYGEEEKKLYKYRNGGTFYVGFNYSFILNPLTNFDGNVRYSNYADPQGKARSSLQMNLGVQRKFFKKKVILSFTAIDPIAIQKFVTYTYGNKFNIENYNSINTRNFRVAVAYQINRIISKTIITDKEKATILEKIKAN